MKTVLSLTVAVLVSISYALAHDTWLQTSASHVDAGQPVRIDLLLGNHGNEHRDFKPKGKWKMDPQTDTITVVDPAGTVTDVLPSFADAEPAAKEGHWTATYTPPSPGLYLFAQTSARVMTYAPVRSIKSAKVFVRVAPADGAAGEMTGFDRVLGHPLEIVPLSDPTAARSGQTFKVKVIYKNEPMPDARVSFIPEGVTLAEGFDDRYERRTDANGEAVFEPRHLGKHLIVTHREEPNESGDGHDATKYGATLLIGVARGATSGK